VTAIAHDHQCMQKFSNGTLSSADLSFLSLVPLDMATPVTLLSFFIDQGLIGAATLAQDCSGLVAPAPAPGPDSDDDSETGLLGSFGSACIVGRTSKEQTVTMLESKLFCQSADDSVCIVPNLTICCTECYVLLGSSCASFGPLCSVPCAVSTVNHLLFIIVTDTSFPHTRGSLGEFDNCWHHSLAEYCATMSQKWYSHV
jgi:hypothetical protein